MQFTAYILAAFSIGSAFAAPSEPKVLAKAIDAVSDAKSAVDTEISIIQNLVVSTVNDEVIPAVNASLANIQDELTNVKNTVVPLIEDIVLPLVHSELDTLPVLVNDVQYIVGEVKDSLSLLLMNLSDDLLELLKTEVDLVIATIEPFVTPVVDFANKATKDTSGTSTTAVQTSIKITKGYVSEITGPIETAINKLV